MMPARYIHGVGVDVGKQTALQIGHANFIGGQHHPRIEIGQDDLKRRVVGRGHQRRPRVTRIMAEPRIRQTHRHAAALIQQTQRIRARQQRAKFRPHAKRFGLAHARHINAVNPAVRKIVEVRLQHIVVSRARKPRVQPRRQRAAVRRQPRGRIDHLKCIRQGRHFPERTEEITHHGPLRKIGRITRLAHMNGRIRPGHRQLRREIRLPEAGNINGHTQGIRFGDRRAGLQIKSHAQPQVPLRHRRIRGPTLNARRHAVHGLPARADLIRCPIGNLREIIREPVRIRAAERNNGFHFNQLGLDQL